MMSSGKAPTAVVSSGAPYPDDCAESGKVKNVFRLFLRALFAFLAPVRAISGGPLEPCRTMVVAD